MQIASGIQVYTDRNGGGLGGRGEGRIGMGGGEEKKRMFERYYIHQFGGALIIQRRDKDVSIVLKKKTIKETKKKQTQVDERKK